MLGDFRRFSVKGRLMLAAGKTHNTVAAREGQVTSRRGIEGSRGRR